MKIERNLKKNENLTKVGDVIVGHPSATCPVFMVVRDMGTGEFRYVNLEKGEISSLRYDTLEEMQDNNKNDTVLNARLVIED